MDDEFNESEFEDSLESGMNSSFNGYGGFNGFGSFGNNNRNDDIRSINDRTGKNEEIRNTDEDYGRTSSREKKRKQEDEEADDITGSKKGKGSDELEGTKSDKDKEDKGSGNYDDSSSDKKDSDSDKKDSDSDSNSEDKKSKEKEESSSDDDSGKSKSGGKFKKYKIYFIIGGIVLALVIIAFLFVALITAIDNLTLGLVSFYGVPESNKDDSSSADGAGLYDDKKFMYDENGNPRNKEDLLAYLESNKSCEGNFWTGISDGWNAFWGNSINDVCEFIRYIEKETGKYNVDQALIFSTVFYGYDTRPTAELYINPSEAPESSPTIEHYEGIYNILNDDNIVITRAKIDDLIKHSHATTKSYYYQWEIEEKTDEEGKVTSITGKCVYKESQSEKYNLDKWKVYMRFGAKAAEKFDEVVLKSKNFETSSDECKDTDGAYTEEALNNQLAAAAANYGSGVTYTLDMSSVNKARKALETPDETASEVFFQAADINSKTKDYFRSYDGIEFDYKNGYAYQNFPSFKPSMESGGAYYGKVKIQYDDIFTAKEIEQLILNIVDRKTNMNYALNREDPDVRDDYSSYLGGYTGVPTGANCMQYLPASLNEIQVKLTDCLGSPIGTVPFADYIIGVANGEVSNKNDDYVKAQMVAAISYALRRHNNYTKGSTIEMRSGNCDQVYCSMMKGCTSKSTPINGDTRFHSYYIGGSKAYPQLYPKYQALYEEASDYLLVKDGAPFNAHYINTSQNRWYEKASRGMAFTQIMQEEYAEEGATLIRCSDKNSTTDNPDLPEEDKDKVGNKPTTEYPKVSPDKGPYYGFSYKDGEDGTHITINPEWKNANLVNVSPKCEGNSEFSSKTFTIHKKAVSNFEKAFKKVCSILTNGVKIQSGETCKYTASELFSDGTVFIERKTSGGSFDLHPYGLAQDINYSKKITVNGKDYTPYNTRNLSDYLEFVNAIGGKEENCKNVNYILWAYAYKDAGFYWGGNYGRNGNSGSYDGKLFELKYN